MPRISNALEEDDLVAPKRPWTRERFKAALQKRYSPRLHMSLILASSGFTAMIASWSLLHMGVGSMLVRYPVAISIAYATFLVGVWTWLRAMGFIDNEGRSRRGSSSSLDGGSIDFPGSGGGGGGGGGGGSPGVSGGGGSFDGGGASASFAETQSMQAVAFSGKGGGGSTPSLGGKGGGFSFDLDGDGIALLLLALALVAVVFVTSGYLIYCAPDVLTEAAFGAALAGTLGRASKQQTPHGWIAGVVKKTWWPYAIVLLAAIVFAGYAAAHFPEATTFRQAIAMAVGR